jgi:hypothetical protein
MTATAHWLRAVTSRAGDSKMAADNRGTPLNLRLKLFADGTSICPTVIGLDPDLRSLNLHFATPLRAEIEVSEDSKCWTTLDTRVVAAGEGHLWNFRPPA